MPASSKQSSGTVPTLNLYTSSLPWPSAAVVRSRVGRESLAASRREPPGARLNGRPPLAPCLLTKAERPSPLMRLLLRTTEGWPKVVMAERLVEMEGLPGSRASGDLPPRPEAEDRPGRGKEWDFTTGVKGDPPWKPADCLLPADIAERPDDKVGDDEDTEVRV